MWTVEIFTFMHMGGSHERIALLPLSRDTAADEEGGELKLALDAEALLGSPALTVDTGSADGSTL